MALLFNNIVNHIYSLDEKHTIVYIAVGSSAGLIEHDLATNSWKIAPTLEQQFPPFLSTLKGVDYKFPTHIILIDSLLEDPPFVICDSKKTVSDDWCKNKNWHFNTVTNTYVYPIRINITYSPYNDDDQINIDDFLQQLNLCAMEKNWFVVFHDFCGRDVGKLAEHFDSLIEGHHDHIVYGLGARLDGGCFIDLTLPECQFEFIIDESYIKVFNPYQYNFVELVNIYNNTNSLIVRSQISMRLENIKLFFKNNFFALIRQLALLKTGKNFTIHEHTFRHISNLYTIDIKSMLDLKEYEQLLNIILGILESELSKHIEITNVRTSIAKMLNEPDIYKWTQYLEANFNVLQ